MSLVQAARLGGIAVTGLSLAALVWLAADRFHQKSIADASEACEAAASQSAKDLSDCGPNVRSRVEADRQTIICEEALLPELRDETRFIAGISCGPGAKRLIVQVEAQTSEIASLRAALDKTSADNAAAISRAEARGRAEQTRKNYVRQIVQDAPVGADGLVRCDAECLRRFAN